MTATPIPRTLQLTIFGDLTISTLNELPAGRQPITTKIIDSTSLSQTLSHTLAELQNGRQAYYICKRISDDPTKETKSVIKETEKLSLKFKNFQVACLHGQMKPAEKDAIMAKFAKNEIQLLVSTTVVEVGVNVPNATIMIIQDADNYGLAALHQLRGRIGRGKHASTCFLVNSSPSGPTRRLRELEKSTDGFHLAEIDLQLRGPGAIYSTLQHGVLDLRIAEITDTKLIKSTSDKVSEFLKTDSLKNYPELAQNIEKYQRLTTLN